MQTCPETPAQPATTPGDEYDSPWKDVVEHAFPEFMAYYFPAAHEQIDWASGHEFKNTELRQIVRDAELGQRHADALVQVTSIERLAIERGMQQGIQRIRLDRASAASHDLNRLLDKPGWTKWGGHLAVPRLSESHLTTRENVLTENIFLWAGLQVFSPRSGFVQQGIQQGKLEGETSLIERQLTRRFGPPSAETQARLKAATLEQLELWAENILDAATLEDVFKNH